ncbi:MAG TPA: 4-hydroxy-3-methylbut-2-enyl diphosphate reductase [Gemmatimonadaceae bacterium]
MSEPITYYRKGLGLKAEVQGTLDADYSGRLVDLMREREFELTAGDTTVRLAREFGFCYGVERAVDYAYQARAKFPGRRVVLVGEIIHNPHVNAKLRAMGVEILMPAEESGAHEGNGAQLAKGKALPRFDYSRIEPDDVVIIPAFGVAIRDFEILRGIGCVLVDTTCGSVLNVWKRVERYAKDGFTALIHGKHYHEETRATASQVEKYEGGSFLVVRDMSEAKLVCEYIEERGDRASFLERFAHAASPGFDPDVHLRRIGVANQTTMLAGESLAIAAEVGAAMERAHGAEYRAANFRSFDTICSATQERQDAVKELLTEPLDVMVVVGGYNSSNTMSLAAICAEHVSTYHVEDATCLDPERGTIRHKVAGKATNGEVETSGWLAAEGPVRVGITAGASTPNNKIGEAVARIFATRGIDPSSIE